MKEESADGESTKKNREIQPPPCQGSHRLLLVFSPTTFSIKVKIYRNVCKEMCIIAKTTIHRTRSTDIKLHVGFDRLIQCTYAAVFCGDPSFQGKL